MPEPKALKESGLVTAINDLFQKNRPWVTCREATGGDLSRAPDGESLLYYPSQPGLARQVDARLFARHNSSVYQLSLAHTQHAPWEFALSKTAPSGSQCILSITSGRVLHTPRSTNGVVGNPEITDSLRTLNGILTGKVIGAEGNKPKTWPQIYPGYPRGL
jgi:hypothetical protein